MVAGPVPTSIGNRIGDGHRIWGIKLRKAERDYGVHRAAPIRSIERSTSACSLSPYLDTAGS